LFPLSLVIAASVFLFASTCGAAGARSEGRRRAAAAGDGERDEERVRRTRAPGGGLGLTLPALLLSLPRLRCLVRRGGERLGLRLGEREGLLLLSSSLLDGRVRRARAANGGDTERDGERECMSDPLCAIHARAVCAVLCSCLLGGRRKEQQSTEKRRPTHFGGEQARTQQSEQRAEPTAEAQKKTTAADREGH
jgi:hypothetical protein